MEKQKRTISQLFKLSLTLTLVIGALQVDAQEVVTQKKKKNNSGTIAAVAGIGIVGTIAAVCLFNNTNNTTTRSQSSSLRNINNFTLNNPPAAATPPRVVAAASPAAPAAAGALTISTRVEMTCLRSSQQKSAFEVTALKEQLMRGATLCGMQDRLRSFSFRFTNEFNQARQGVASYFRNRTREDRYMTDLAGHQSLVNNSFVNGNGGNGAGQRAHCAIQDALYRQVEGLRNPQEIIQLAATHQQPLVSPCGATR